MHSNRRNDRAQLHAKIQDSRHWLGIIALFSDHTQLLHSYRLSVVPRISELSKQNPGDNHCSIKLIH